MLRLVIRRTMSTNASSVANFVNVTEGKATILFPATTNEVFYNPIQQFNRDLSVAVIRNFIPQYKQEVLQGTIKRSEKEKANPPITVLEALSASGLRAVRYFHEIPNLSYVVANDLSASAVKNIERNVLHNNLKLDQVIPNHGDANMLMYQHREHSSSLNPLDNARFTVVDLDPYGTASTFLDAAVQSVDEGGLLCVTCTDMAVLSGNHSDACWAKYGSMSIRTPYCHEMAVRIVLANISTHAARHKRYIVPYLSLSIDFYVRMFVRVYTSALETKRSASKLSYVYHCGGCGTFHLQPVGKRQEDGNSRKYTPGTGPVVPQNCPHCSKVYKVGGPIWSEPMHDLPFVEKVLNDIKQSPEDSFGTMTRMKGMLTLVQEELQDVPLYYCVPELAQAMNCRVPSYVQIHSAIWNANYRSSYSHANQNALKTDCPPDVLWDIMRSWVKITPVVLKNVKPNSPAAKLLAVEPKFEASFESHPNANPPSRKFHLVRFPENPPNSGPLSRAKSGTTKKQRGSIVSSSSSNSQPLKRKDADEEQDDEEEQTSEGELKEEVVGEEEEAEETGNDNELDDGNPSKRHRTDPL